MPLLTPNRLRSATRDLLTPTPEEKSIIDLRLPSASAWKFDEHLLQKTIIREAILRLPHHHHRLHAIPNGGGRSKSQAGKLKAEGVRPGVPDIFLPYPSGPHHGLYLELKKAHGTVSADQWDWLTHLHRHGYRCHIINDPTTAHQTLLNYLTPA